MYDIHYIMEMSRQKLYATIGFFVGMFAGVIILNLLSNSFFLYSNSGRSELFLVFSLSGGVFGALLLGIIGRELSKMQTEVAKTTVTVPRGLMFLLLFTMVLTMLHAHVFFSGSIGENYILLLTIPINLLLIFLSVFFCFSKLLFTITEKQTRILSPTWQSSPWVGLIASIVPVAKYFRNALAYWDVGLGDGEFYVSFFSGIIGFIVNILIWLVLPLKYRLIVYIPIMLLIYVVVLPLFLIAFVYGFENASFSLSGSFKYLFPFYTPPPPGLILDSNFQPL